MLHEHGSNSRLHEPVRQPQRSLALGRLAHGDDLLGETRDQCSEEPGLSAGVHAGHSQSGTHRETQVVEPLVEYAMVCCSVASFNVLIGESARTYQ